MSDPVASSADAPVPRASGSAVDAAGSDEQEGRREREAITGRAGIVAAGTLASRVLGLGREQVLAGVFSRAETDIFFFAFIIPNLLRQLFAEGAIHNAVTPVLAATRQSDGDEAARDFFRHLRGLSLCLLVAVTVAGMFFAPELVRLFASGYTARPEQLERTVSLTRWVFPYIFFMGTAALGVSALNTHGRYVVTSFAPSLFNVCFIVAALALPATLVAAGHDPLIALAAGVLVGGALQVVAQWPSLAKIGYLRSPGLHFSHTKVREVLRRMAPVLFGVGIYYVDVVAARRLLSHYEVGSLSYFTFAMRLCDFPQGIFVMALQAATLPSLSRLATFDDKTELIKTFAFGMRMSLFVALSASVALMVLAEPIVVLIFQRGAFDRTAAVETAHSLVAQGAGVWMVACVRQLVAVFYALGDTRTPVIVSAVDFVAFVALAYTLGPVYGHVGVSLAITGASLVQLVMLWVLLRRSLGPLLGVEVLGAAVRALVAALPAGAAAWGVAAWMAPWLTGGGFARLVPGLAALTVFGVVFLAASFALRSEEFGAMARPIAARVRRRRA